MNKSTEQRYDPWIGVDLDGTIASNEFTTTNPLHIGPPVPAMVERVKRWLREGKKVKIFTARVHSDYERHSIYSVREAIEQWCLEHIGDRLEVTCQKDYMMVESWDDRNISVQENTGKYVRILPDGKIRTK